MDNKLRDFGEEAVKNIQEQAGDDNRVPPLANKAGSCIQIALVFLTTFFGITYATYYSNQSVKTETYGPLYVGLGIFFGLLLGAFLGLGVKWVIRKFYSRKAI
jgi:hypothetical protein